MTAADVLGLAKARIEAKGWGQGFAASGLLPGCRTECAGVALDRAYFASDRTVPYARPVELFREAIGGGDIVPWNDAPGRTQAGVLAAFDRAIALAEAEAAQ